MKKHDRFLTRRYLMNALKSALRDKALRSKLVAQIACSEEELEAIDAGFLVAKFRELGLDEARDAESAFGNRPRRSRRRGTGADPGLGVRAKEFLSWAVEALGRSIENPPAEGAEARATALAVRRFGLGGACGPVLELARLYDARRSFAEDLWDAAKDALGDPVEASATLLGVSGARVEQALRRLTEVGIADPDTWSRNGAEPDDYVEDWFECVYRPPVASEEELRERLVPLAPEPLLGLDAFAHLDERDDAVRFLKAAVRSRESVRVVLCGRAGTGKTEFAKTLARAGGARLYELCESESQGAWGAERTDRRMDPSADKRNRLRMASALLRSEPGAAILCDEVEDVLSSGAGSRRENHELVENAPVPIVYRQRPLAVRRGDAAPLRPDHPLQGPQPDPPPFGGAPDAGELRDRAPAR